MTLKRWYQLCLFLPIFVPLFFGLICWIMTGSFSGAYNVPRPAPVMPFMTIPLLVLSGITEALLLGLWLSGVEYLVFAALTLWLLRDKDAVYLGRISYLLPLFFFPFFATGFCLKEGGLGMLALTFIAIPYGYLYVFLAHILTWLALKTGKVVDTLS